MLVLTRKKGQDVFVGDDVRVRVVRVRGNTVALAIEAPREVVVDRGEVRERKLARHPIKSKMPWKVPSQKP